MLPLINLRNFYQFDDFRKWVANVFVRDLERFPLKNRPRAREIHASTTGAGNLTIDLKGGPEVNPHTVQRYWVLLQYLLFRIVPGLIAGILA